MNKRQIFWLLLLLVAPLSLFAQDGFAKKSFVSSEDVTLNYRELTPENAKPNKKYPLVLFLHGAGERGSDNELQLTHGANMFLNPTNLENFPCYALFPQCPKDEYWFVKFRKEKLNKEGVSDIPTKTTPIFNSVKELLDSYINRDDVDKDRIYIVGLSMGAMATYDMVTRYPDIFAAAIPICGAVNVAKISTSKGIDKVKFRIFHGDKDSVVPTEGSRSAYRELKKCGVDVEYREYPGCDHNSWNPAFNEKDFMSWLFKQHR